MPARAPPYGPAPRSPATYQAMIAATAMIAPCDRFSTPDTPKISVKPMAPRA